MRPDDQGTGEMPAGNSPASRDIAFHMHPYTNPAMLADAGPHIIAEGSGVFVTDDSGKRFYLSLIHI